MILSAILPLFYLAAVAPPVPSTTVEANAPAAVNLAAPSAEPPAEPVAAPIDAGEPTQVERILRFLDWSVTLVALAVAAIGAVPFLRPGERPALTDGPPRPNSLREDSVLLAVAVYFLTAGAVAMILSAASTPDGLWTTLAVDLSARVVGGAACVWAAIRSFGGGLRAFLFGPPRRGWVMTTLAWTLLAVGLAPLIGELTVRVFETISPGYQPPAHPTLDRLGQRAGQLAVVAVLWFSAAVITPLAEELFFRGMLQNVLGNFARSRGLAVFLASLAFGFVHLGQPFAIPALVFVGLCAGLLYERTGSLLAAILLHMAFNLKTLIWHALIT